MTCGARSLGRNSIRRATWAQIGFWPKPKAKPERSSRVSLDLNNPVFQDNLLNLQKPERHSALETLKKLRQMSWAQVYGDKGLKWEKIVGVAPPDGMDAVYSLRITQSRRATAYRDGNFIRFLTIAPDHDAPYGRN
jgi:hypothetical protein